MVISETIKLKKIYIRRHNFPSWAFRGDNVKVLIYFEKLQKKVSPLRHWDMIGLIYELRNESENCSLDDATKSIFRIEKKRKKGFSYSNLKVVGSCNLFW